MPSVIDGLIMMAAAARLITGLIFRAVGVPVTGLADDNNVGPFSFGFDFPYYWYTVNHMWIGSNGYTSFSSNANFAHPFADIPTATQPNDLMAVLTGDLDFSRGNAHCYFYTNNSDSVIVSWVNVGEFGYIDSLHTFQVILSKADSSITYQYGANHGRFLDSSGGTMTVIGIENVNGQVGIQYLRSNLPANHMWHEGLALRFYPQPDPNFVVHDFGMMNSFNETSGAEFIPLSQGYQIRAEVKNFGNQAESNMKVRVQVKRGATIVVTDTVLVASLSPSQAIWVDFARLLTPTVAGTYKATFSSILTGDQNPNNNSLISELDAFQLPQVLRYCGDLAATGRSWTGDFSGFGSEYVVPQAVELTSCGFYVYSVTAAGPGYVYILVNNDQSLPDFDHPLFVDTVQVSDTGWVNVDLSNASLTFGANQKFYMVALHALENTFQFGMDQTTPLSNRGWEYTGGLAPDRDRSVSDIMFKVNAEGATGIEESITPKSFTLSQNYPNPFNAQTNISFSLAKDSDISLKIYNIIGQQVQDLSGRYKAGNNIVTWDASRVASGVYFYRVDTGNASETKRMLLLK